MLPALRVQVLEGRPHQVRSDLPHLLHDLRLEVVVLVRVGGVQVPLELAVGQFVRRLVLPVVLALLLDRVVGQVDHVVPQVVQVVLLAAGPDVALLVPVPSDVPVAAGDQQVVSDVEFPPAVEERLQVLLDDQRSALGTFPLLAVQDGQQFGCLHHLYSGAAVGVFAWFDDPDVVAMLVLLGEGLQIGGSFRIFEAVGFGQDEEGVHFVQVAVVPEHHLEEDPLCPDYAVEGNVVAHSADFMRGKTRDCPAPTSLVPLVRDADLFLPHDFEEILLVGVGQQLGSFGRFGALVLCLFIGPVLPLMNTEISILGPAKLKIGTIGELYPKPPFQQALDEEPIVACADLDLVGQLGLGERKVDIESVGKVDLVEKLNVVCNLLLIDCISPAHS